MMSHKARKNQNSAPETIFVSVLVYSVQTKPNQTKPKTCWTVDLLPPVHIQIVLSY